MKALMEWMVVLLLVISPVAWAEVIAKGPGGFSLKVVTTTSANPEEAYLAFTRIDKWWDPAHTYSGDAANLTLTIQPGGAFVEALPGVGFATHMELSYVVPAKEIRLLGGLGPLQPMGVHGALTVQFNALDKGTQVTMLYSVSGFSEKGLETLAPIVDGVQTDQMRRHAAYADTL